MEISEEQATIVENCFVKLKGLLDPATVPEDVAKMLTEAEQIISGILDSGKQGMQGDGQQFGGPK
jgi:hypothetical protein